MGSQGRVSYEFFFSLGDAWTHVAGQTSTLNVTVRCSREALALEAWSRGDDDGSWNCRSC